jgi:hypothetical protein
MEVSIVLRCDTVYVAIEVPALWMTLLRLSPGYSKKIKLHSILQGEDRIGN